MFQMKEKWVGGLTFESVKSRLSRSKYSMELFQHFIQVTIVQHDQ